MNTMIYNIYILLFIAVISVIGIKADSSYAQPQDPTPLAMSGEELFIQMRCVRCHTIGRGRFVGPDLSGLSSRYSQEEIIKWIVNPQQIYQESGKMPYNQGYPPMPPTNVSPDQATLIADYVSSFKPSGSASAKGRISGQVANKTTDLPAKGVELILTSYMGDRATGEEKISSDAKGNFSFDNLSWDRSYVIAINYKGTQYATDKMVFYPSEDVKTLDLPIYEPTFDEDDIAVLEAHMIVQELGGELSFANIVLFQNSGNMVYVGGRETADGRKESLRLNIPKGAENINFIHGANPEDLEQTEYGFADTTSVLPGQKRLVYTYSMPLGSGPTDIVQTIDYPTEGFMLLVSDTGKNSSVSGLSGGEEVEVQGQKFRRWTGADLMPGHKVELRIYALLLKSGHLKWGALGFLLLIVVIGVVYSYISKDSPVLEQDDMQDDLTAKRQLLIREIAKLDDDYEASNIDEDTYRKIREGKKQELKKIIRRL